MKKFLSLVLVLVMSMSMVTVSAGAKDYTDASEITYKEAVDVMSELKIIDGYTDGSFNPDATLTRGAAAKIICNLILGPTTAAALQADTAPFADVPANHTFAGYIAYCAQQGIISGYADGTFKPANGLTGYAFMKMLLGALGYDQNTEGYVGANYSIQVAKQALAIGLDEGNDNFDGTRIVTREEALLYAFNTLKATMVEYTAKTEISTGNSVVTISGSRKEVDTNKADYAGRDDSKLQFVEKYFSTVTMKDDTVDAFGRWTNTWYKSNKEIGSYTKTPDAIYHADVNQKTVYADLDLNEAYDFEVVVDGAENVIGTFSATKKGTGKLSAVNAEEIIGNGSDIYVYLNDEATEGSIVVINTYLAEVADDYDEKNESLDITGIDMLQYTGDWDGEELLTEDWAGLDAYADGDYMLVTIADGAVQSVAKSEPVKATVTEYVHAESVTAGGEEYKYSAASLHNDDNGEIYSYELKSEYALYLDEEGHVLFADGEEAEDKYVYIDEFSSHSTSSRAAADAYAYFVDGTEAEIKVSHMNGTSVTAGNVADNAIKIGDKTYENGWYTYTVKSDKYKLTPVTAQTGEITTAADTDVVNYKKNHTEITDGTNTYDGTSKTNFIIVDEDGDVKVYAGIKEVPAILSAADTVVNMVYSGSYATHVFIDLGKGEMGSSDISSDIIFLLELGNQGNDADDEEYYKYTALVNGEEKSIKVDKDVFVKNEVFVTSNALLCDVEYTGKNYVSDATVVTGAMTDRDDMTADTVVGNGVAESNGTLIIGDQANNDYFMAEKYTIYAIDTDGDYDTFTVKQLVREVVTKGSFEVDGASIYGVMNDDGEYTALYIAITQAGKF